MQIDFKINLTELKLECLHNETSRGQSYNFFSLLFTPYFKPIQGFVIFCAKCSDNEIDFRDFGHEMLNDLE